MQFLMIFIHILSEKKLNKSFMEIISNNLKIDIFYIWKGSSLKKGNNMSCGVRYNNN